MHASLRQVAPPPVSVVRVCSDVCVPMCGANPTGRLYGGGGGGGGFMTVPTVHPEGIGCTGVTGMNSRQNGDPAPNTVVANQSDGDWGGAGQGAQYKYPEGWSEANACGASGRIVLKAPA